MLFVDFASAGDAMSLVLLTPSGRTLTFAALYLILSTVSDRGHPLRPHVRPTGGETRVGKGWLTRHAPHITGCYGAKCGGGSVASAQRAFGLSM